MDISSEIQAMVRRRICGQVLVFSAHGGRLFRFGRAFVAWKIASAVASMDRTIRLQAKLMPRRKIFAILTRTLTFCLLLAFYSELQMRGELTISLACSFSREASCFSRSCSSLKVGLKIMLGLPGVRGGAPGDFKALFRGAPLGVGGGRYFRSVSSISTG